MLEDDEPIGVGGIEIAGDATAESKRFHVRPSHRGSGAAAHAVRMVRLETGDQQARAIRFHRRHGFEPIERFGPYVDSGTSVCMSRSLV